MREFVWFGGWGLLFVLLALTVPVHGFLAGWLDWGALPDFTRGVAAGALAGCGGAVWGVGIAFRLIRRESERRRCS